MLLNLPCHKLKIGMVTRCNSMLDMLDRFLEQQPSITATLLSPEIRRSEKDLCTLAGAEIMETEDIVKALPPMKAATLALSGESSATLSVIAPLHAQLLEEMRQTTSDSAVIKELKSAVHNNLRFRYANLKEKLHVASALDLCFKTLPFISDKD
ncbi:hypothetical protein PGIGA_G00199350 [Pangasianodon gigas]|uniref:Uncharacterized protein n=1 Tax=Pangasianodon gigas TaxID=30993 RepID=A0ACC5WE41_PANGG|nr:hypothetical protein [Pangasianodon gigas]